MKPSEEVSMGIQSNIPSESIVREIKRKPRRKFTAEEKIRIILDGFLFFLAICIMTY
jgi:hypothetical protein